MTAGNKADSTLFSNVLQARTMQCKQFKTVWTIYCLALSYINKQIGFVFRTQSVEAKNDSPQGFAALG